MSDVFELYRCRECGRVADDLGRLHAHAERHRGLFGLQWPWRVGDYRALMELTEVLRVDEADLSVVGPDEWGGP